MVDSLLETNQVDDSTDYYESLVGENKKFKDAKELAKGKYIADNYIHTLESQMDQMRKDYLKEKEQNTARDKLEDLLDRLEKRQPDSMNIKPLVEEQKPASIKKEDIESLVDTRIQERETARKQTENYNFVKQKLVEKWGNNYSDQLNRHMSDLGITEDYVNQTAHSNPKVLLKMLGVDDVVPNRDPFAPPRSQIRTDNFKPTTEVRDWQWYQDLKVKDPKKYYSPTTNVQMHKDALALGERFETGDFNRFEKDFRINY